VDLSGLRELYIHSSLSDYNTLTSGGMRDVIAVMTIDQDWGSLVTYRPIGLADQEVLQLPDNGLQGAIHIYMTDAIRHATPTAGPDAVRLSPTIHSAVRDNVKRTCCVVGTSRAR
jgi:hypothetical protein